MLKTVAVAGIASNVGKTSLACDLLNHLDGWEAIKVTKGHFRSCGKDPHACCVSHLLAEEPLVMSGRDCTYAPGKDSGRFWDAGASNVHWVVATKNNVLDGVRAALARVAPDAPGVIIEGTGFLRWIAVDCAIMVVGRDPKDLKASAARVMSQVDYLFLSGSERGDTAPLDRLAEMLRSRGYPPPANPVLYQGDLPRLVELVAGCGLGVAGCQ